MNCPECSRPVAPSAIMCGFCEREIPRVLRFRRRPRWQVPSWALAAVVGAVLLAGLIFVIPWRSRPQTEAEKRASAEQMQVLLQKTALSAADMEFVYGFVRQTLQDRHGLVINHPLNPNFVTMEEIKAKGGDDVAGYTSSMQLSNGAVMGIEVFVPVQQSPVFSVHVMAHELGHCWQHDNQIQLKAFSPLKREGFCEWVAAHMLEDLDASDPTIQREIERDLRLMRRNSHSEYSQGLLYFEALEKEKGSAAVFAEMLGTAGSAKVPGTP